MHPFEVYIGVNSTVGLIAVSPAVGTCGIVFEKTVQMLPCCCHCRVGRQTLAGLLRML